MDPGRYASLFLADTREHLGRVGALLLDWEREPDAPGPVAELFRAFHSVKGAAATMGYGGVAELAHAAEDLLAAVRRGELAGSRAVVGLLLRAADVLEAAAEAAVGGEAAPDAAPLAEALARMAASGAPRSAMGSRTAVGVAARRGAARPVRIEPARLDELLNQAGELVVARNRLDALSRGSRRADLEAVSGQLGTLITGLYHGVLRARLAPIAELFGRFPRVVRDLGETLGKAVRLELRADGIELDRGVLEELVDPLVHLVRNAVDHGIEHVAHRVRAGKPPEGRLVLWAERRREWVAVCLSDDGRGIDRALVAERARALGHWAGAREPDDGELLALLARPGFTVKHEVTEVSGRGVGMDVVVSTVRALGGRVALETRVGAGTTFTLAVPLTTAIQRVLLVGVGAERYAIPSRMLVEAGFVARPADREAPPGGRFSFRGASVPMVDLASVTGTRSAGPPRRPVLVVEWGEHHGAVAVDALLGQSDVLIERVAAPRGLPAWVTGATILADGSPAFVLDPTALF